MKKLLLIILLVFLVGCGPSRYQKEIFDNDELIAKSGDSFNFYKKITVEENNGSKTEFGSFTGSYTIDEIEGSCTIEFDIVKNITSGRFKVVLISPDNEVEIIDSRIVVVLDEGTYRVKIVGDKAKGMVDFGYFER